MENKLENYVAIFNEMMVSLYLYVIMVLNLFSQGKYPHSYRNTCSLILISVVIASVGFNLLVFIIQIILMVRIKFLRWFYSRKKAIIDPIKVE
jgi:hypothetical protein